MHAIVMPSFLETTEQLVNNPDAVPDGFRVYHVDGRTIWCSPETRNYLQSLQGKVQDFVDSCPMMENLGDNQDYVMAFCRDTGLSKPCYNDWCTGCDEDDAEFCSSPDESWQD